MTDDAPHREIFPTRYAAYREMTILAFREFELSNVDCEDAETGIEVATVLQQAAQNVEREARSQGQEEIADLYQHLSAECESFIHILGQEGTDPDGTYYEAVCQAVDALDGK